MYLYVQNLYIYISLTTQTTQMKTTTQRVKEIRNELKNVLPAYKFSVTKRHYNGVTIVILSGPTKLTETHESVNHYYINESTDPVKRNVLTIIDKIANEGVSYRETGDYGWQPDFYVNIKIGEYDRYYIQK